MLNRNEQQEKRIHTGARAKENNRKNTRKKESKLKQTVGGGGGDHKV
jgi:hypothetical protein